MYTMNAREYNNNVMNGAFKKVYPEIARQILARTGVTRGKCIDLGGGPGMLGIWLAKLSDLEVTVYDLMPECVELVEGNSKANNVEGRISAQQGKAEQMDFEDNSADLIVSRGSVFFWEDKEQGLSEVYRVLKPGGWGYIGGGFGNKKILDEVLTLRANDTKWLEQRKKRIGQKSIGKFKNLLAKLHIDGTVEHSDIGTWIIFRKQ